MGFGEIGGGVSLDEKRTVQVEDSIAEGGSMVGEEGEDTLYSQILFVTFEENR